MQVIRAPLEVIREWSPWLKQKHVAITAGVLVVTMVLVWFLSRPQRSRYPESVYNVHRRGLQRAAQYALVANRLPDPALRHSYASRAVGIIEALSMFEDPTQTDQRLGNGAVIHNQVLDAESAASVYLSDFLPPDNPGFVNEDTLKQLAQFS